MKKYVKPVLIFERYELSQNIADCSWEVEFADENACMAYADEALLGSGWGSLFTNDRGCNIDVDTGVEEYCYHASSQFFTVFKS